MKVKLSILSCLAVMCAEMGMLHAQNRMSCDSMAAAIEKLPHDESRLEAYSQLIIYAQDDLDACKCYNDQLLVEAELQNNSKYKCDALFTQILMAYNTYDTEKVKALAEQLIPLARREGQFDLMFRTWRCLIDFMILTQDYERNEREARRMLEEAQAMDNMTGILEAYQCLANIYGATFRKDEAISILEKALPLAIKMGNLAILSNVWQPLIFLYSEAHEFKKWLPALKEFEHYLSGLKVENSRMWQSTLLVLYASYADYYTQTKDLQRAGYYLDKSELYFGGIDSPLYQIYHDQISAYYYRAMGKYEKALQKIDFAIEAMGVMSQNTEYNELRLFGADLLCKLGRPAEAAAVYRDVLAFRDSMHVVSINKQYEQLKKDFNADQLLLEGARLRHNMQLWMLILLGAGLLTAAFFAAYMFRAHRVLRRAAEEMRAMSRNMDQANEAKNRLLSNISSTIRKPLETVVEGSLCLATQRIESPEEQQRLASTIRKMSAELLKMINDILDLSRLEAGMMKFEITDAEVVCLLHDAACAIETPQNRIVIRTEYRENTLFFAQIDPNRMQQAFRSLLIKAESDDTVLVTVSRQGERLQIRIAGTVLAQEKLSQDAIIRNEINRMLFVRFGGTYELAKEGNEIVISLPVNETQMDTDEKPAR